jgi:hypothetical protein
LFNYVFEHGEGTDFLKELQLEPLDEAFGNTHRWNYLYRDRPKYCSYYFKKHVSDEKGFQIKMLRPAIEIWERMISPERQVKDLDSWVNVLLCAAVENCGNRHAMNRIMHYYYDA